MTMQLKLPAETFNNFTFHNNNLPRTIVAKFEHFNQPTH